MEQLPGERGTLRILVADDEPLVRTGLRCLLQEHLEPAGISEAGTVDEVLELVRRERPQIVLLDANLAGMPEHLVIPQIVEIADDVTRVIVLALDEPPGEARTAFEAGARGLVAKRASVAEILDAIAEVSAGRMYLDPYLGALMAAGNERAGGDARLTERERRVLGLVAAGYTNRQIASRLGVSDRTVESVRSRAQHRLGLRGRADVVAYVQAHEVA